MKIFSLRILLLILVFGLSAEIHASPDTEANAISALLKSGSQYQRQGLYLKAEEIFQQASLLAGQTDNRLDQALAQTALGYITYLLNRPEQAKPILESALLLADQLRQPKLTAMVHYYLGLCLQQLNLSRDAQHHLELALQQAVKAANAHLISRIHLSLALLASDKQDIKVHHAEVLSQLPLLTNDLAGELHLIFSEQLLTHPMFPKLTTESAQDAERLRLIYTQLDQANQKIAPKQHQQKAKYFRLLAQVYETQKRFTEALVLNRQAIEELQKQPADDLLMYAEWQAAQLYQATNNEGQAIAAYRRAIVHLQRIRQDIPVHYHDGKSSFLQLFGPLYRGLASLLLKQSAHEDGLDARQILLQEASTMMDKLKQTELEDFFNDRCLLTAEKSTRQNRPSEHTAIFYPILLPDRIELLLNIDQTVSQATVYIDVAELEVLIRRYARHLRRGQQDNSNLHLYDLLIRPLEKTLQAHSIDTLVFIPDGVMRLLPLAALNDGQHYLIEQYALATLPGLAILSADTRHATIPQTLLVGLSQPSTESIAELPKYILQNLAHPANDNPVGERGLDELTNVRSVASKLRSLITDSSGRSLQPEILAEALALPGVETEISALARQMPGNTLLNQTYTLGNFQQHVQDAPYSNIHIASHGFFGGDSEQSFIMTYDKFLTINHLENLLSERNRGQAVDLLVLSACQTAEGDDRAPLGLSGVALKAHAHSALGTLWPISDSAAVEVMTEFYSGLNKSLTKAKALQQAQIKLIHSETMQNPFYWAPFSLVGQWM